MAGPGFVTSWLPQQRHPRLSSSSTRISVNPLRRPTQMVLVSHEKLEVIFDSAESEMAKYRLELQIPASFSKAKRRECMAVLRKNANYRGFRKGTVPPFIMKTVPTFVLKDSVDDILGEALKELDLKPLEGEAAEPELDFKELQKDFVVGQDFTFSVEMALNKFTGELTDSPGEEVIDVEGHAELDTADMEVERRKAADKQAQLAASAKDQIETESS